MTYYLNYQRFHDVQWILLKFVDSQNKVTVFPELMCKPEIKEKKIIYIESYLVIFGENINFIKRVRSEKLLENSVKLGPRLQWRNMQLLLK